MIQDIWKSVEPHAHGLLTDAYNSGTTTPKLSLSLNATHNSYVRWNATAGVQSREGEIRDTGNCIVSLPSRRAVAGPDEDSCTWRGGGTLLQREDTPTLGTQRIEPTISVILLFAYFFL
jgi:hypothetical protein